MNKKSPANLMRPDESKQKKKTVESLRESIAKVETLLTLAINENNHRAELSAENVLIGLRSKMAALKSKD